MRQETLALVREQILTTIDNVTLLFPSTAVARCGWAGVSKLLLVHWKNPH